MGSVKPIGICPDCKCEITAIGSQLRLGRNDVRIFCLKCARRRVLAMELAREEEKRAKEGSRAKEKGAAKTAKKSVKTRRPALLRLRKGSIKQAHRKRKVVRKRV